MEALHLRMIYWGKLAGDGSRALIGRETVEFALKHLLEMTIRVRSQRDRLGHVHSELSEYLGRQAAPAKPQEPTKAPPGPFQALKDKLLGTKGHGTA
jgi:hypothetical protein